MWSGRQVIDRILYKLDELVRPFVHKILVVIEPLLIDEDYYARVEGREIIANLSKAAGLATMIAAMRPDIDNIDECASSEACNCTLYVCISPGIGQLKKSQHDVHRGQAPCPTPSSCAVSGSFLLVVCLVCVFIMLMSDKLWDMAGLRGCCSNAQVRAQHHGARVQRGRVGAGHPGAAALPEGGVPEQKELAGAAHRHQDRAADRHPARLRGAAAPQGAPTAWHPSTCWCISRALTCRV